MILDTSAVIEFLRGGERIRSIVAAALQSGEVIATTAISYFELMAPISHMRLKKEEMAIRALVGEIRMLPLDQKASEEAAQIMGALLRVGRPINALDVLIAGVAVANKASAIVTSDLDFQQVEKVADLRAVLI